MTLVDDYSTSGRAVGLRKRADLEFSEQRHGGQRIWAVKDPLTLRYFHLREEEYTVLSMLDGCTSMAAIQSRFARMFAPRVLSAEALHGFLAMLHRQGLAVADSAGQAEQLLVRRDERRRRRHYERFASPLAVRFRGISPQRLLDWLEPKFGWLFSRWCVALWLGLACVAVLLISVRVDELQARLSEFREVVSAANLPWLILTIAATKGLHELGHALACRRFGGECNEMGVLFLVFMPCLYCNVSDSWMLPSKWQRIAVAAAGIYVEMILATIATFLWWASAPGLFNALCLNVILVCSLGAVFLNGNPLLRYDGYYIFSDLVEVPNLAAQASLAVRRTLARWCLGVVLPDEGIAPPRRQRWLWVYAVASAVYRVVILLVIFWGLREIARPYHLQPAVTLLACLTLGVLVGPEVSAFVRWVRHPLSAERIVPARAAVSGLLLFAGLLVIAFVKMPMHVTAPLVVEYRDAERVYVTVPGTLVEAARVGQSVQAGDLLARLDSADVRLQVTRLTSERDQQQLYLDNLEAQRLQGIANGAPVPAAKVALADIQERLAQVERDAARLAIVAPVAGTVLPPPNRPRRPSGGETLDTWSDVPLSERNSGAFLDRGTPICLVGDPRQFEAVLHVEQADIELVEIGQAVRMVLDHRRGETLEGRVVEIAKLDLKVMPRELAAAHDLPARTDARGAARPLSTWYQVRVQFADEPAHLIARVHGGARITVASQSIAAQCARFVRQAFSR